MKMLILKQILFLILYYMLRIIIFVFYLSMRFCIFNFKPSVWGYFFFFAIRYVYKIKKNVIVLMLIQLFF